MTDADVLATPLHERARPGEPSSSVEDGRRWTPAVRPVARHPERRRVQALGDDALVLAMRADDPWAWSEFVARVRPVLEGYAARVRIDDVDHASCVDGLLSTVALHLAEPHAPVPSRLAPYVLRAAVRCRRQSARDRRRREAWHVAAAQADLALGLPEGAGVVGSVISMYGRRAAMPADGLGSPAGNDALGGASVGVDDTPAARAVSWLVRRLTAELRPDERQVLTWTADGVPHRQIAAWLGLSYDAVAKRVQRLCRRLGARVPELAAELPHAERDALERLLSRALTTRGTGGGVRTTRSVAETPAGSYAPTEAMPDERRDIDGPTDLRG